MVEVVPELAVVLVAIGGLIFCYLAIYCARAFAGVAHSTIGRLPILGGWIDAGIHTVVQKIVDIFAEAANSCQAAMGWSFHLMARQIDWLGREINAHANLLFMLSAALTGINLINGLRAATHFAQHEIARLWGNTALIARSVARPIYGELKQLERWTYPRVRAAEHAIGVTIPKELDNLWAWRRSTEDTLASLWKAVRANEKLLVSTAFVGAVAAALTRLGLDWLKCDSAKSFFKKSGCGFWKLLEDALGLIATLALATFALLRPEVLAEGAVTAVDALEPILAEILKD